MASKTSKTLFLVKAHSCGLLWILLVAAALPVIAKSEGHVIVKKTLAAEHRSELVSKLRLISGWSKLDFDRDGILQLDIEETSSGSQRARDLLVHVVNSAKLIIVEDASSRSDVVFCKVTAARWSDNNHHSAPTFVVLIDFADFHKVMGDKLALEAFDVGWAFLHELDHVVQDSEDPTTAQATGDCEDHINLMRQQLGLPIRMDYFFTRIPVPAEVNLVSRFVRLRFEKRNSLNKVDRYWLIWDAALVGGMEDQQQTASVTHGFSSLQ